MDLTNGRFINFRGEQMALSNLEKQQKRLLKLNEKIKLEKEKIERSLGHEIIKNSNLEYSEFTKDKISEIGKLFGSEISVSDSKSEQNNDDFTDSKSTDLNNQTNSNF